MASVKDSAKSIRVQKPSPVATVVDPDVFTAEQFNIFKAIADAVVPTLSPKATDELTQLPVTREAYDGLQKRISKIAGRDKEGQEFVDAFLTENATSLPLFNDALVRMMTFNIAPAEQRLLRIVFSTLNTRAGALVLTGHSTLLPQLSVQAREKVLQGWCNSRIAPLRQIGTTLTTICKALWLRTSPSLGNVLERPNVPVHDAAPLDAYPFKFIQVPLEQKDEPLRLQTDVVVVGSGCGGAVAAKTLAEAGAKVLVVEKGYYWAPEHLPMNQHEGSNHLFHNGGLLQSDDMSIVVLAGSTWGGGGSVNWSASLQTQGMVRQEWSQKFGLPYYTSSAFQADLDAVCDRMGVGSHAIEHNKTNRVLLDGARKLGWSHKVVPQNTAGEAHYCGYCTMGCGSCGKKGPTESFLPDAARAGAEFLEGFDVQEVVFDKVNGEKKAVGIRGYWVSRDSENGVAGTDRTRREVIIEAKKVILSASTLNTPLILLRSGLTNKHIGRHLHLHPTSLVGAVWDEDVRPWEGPILTSVVSEIENMDGEGYGSKLEAMTMMPCLFLTVFPWKSGAEYKEFAAKMRRMTGWISLARDRYGGRVYPDPTDGRCRVAYSPSKHDRAHILEGVIRLASMAYVEGAREVFVNIPGVSTYVKPASADESPEGPSLNDPGFKAWLDLIRTTTLDSADVKFGSAHQMGTCRMGSAPSNSVIDPSGQVWGTSGLYVCDGSALPSASGVNPMVTIMAISRGIARGIAKEFVGTANGTVHAKL